MQCSLSVSLPSRPSAGRLACRLVAGARQFDQVTVHHCLYVEDAGSQYRDRSLAVADSRLRLSACLYLQPSSINNNWTIVFKTSYAWQTCLPLTCFFIYVKSGFEATCHSRRYINCHVTYILLSLIDSVRLLLTSTFCRLYNLTEPRHICLVPSSVSCVVFYAENK